MSFAQSHRYKLYCVYTAWGFDDTNEYRDEEIDDVYMSAFPSRDDLIDALRKADQLLAHDLDFIDSLSFERPDGWYYRQIKVYGYGDKSRCLWKFKPAP
jgi:hypothetical protein